MAITLFITFFMASVFFFTFQSLLKKSLIESTEFSLNQAMSSISGEMESLLKLSRWADTNTIILSYLSDHSQSNRQKLDAYKRLNEEYSNTKAGGYISRIIIADKTGRFIQEVKASSDSSSRDYAIMAELPFFSELLEAPDYRWIGMIPDPHNRTNQNKQVIPIIRPVYSKYNNTVVGWTYLAVTSDIITDILKQYPLPADSSIYFTMDETSYLYRDGNLEPVKASYTVTSDLSEKTFYEGNTACAVRDSSGNSRTMVTCPSNVSGWYLSQSLSDMEFSQQKKVYYLLLFISCLIILSLGIALIYLLNRIINVPITAISKKVDEISRGDFSYDAQIEWNHELGNIGRGINQLSRDVVQLMEKRIEDENKQRELEYQILQSQINPHFLYNTLNSIKWMATIQNASGIAEMTTALSRLLKSIAKGTRQIIPIREELALLKNYVLIQTYRYGGNISIDYQIEQDELLDCMIPKLTLQPIVENAIFHGIEAKGEYGRITVSIKKQGQEIRIDITDNGIGMSEDLIKEVLEEKAIDKEHDFFKKIGIGNVHQRLQYTFGSAYGLTIESQPGSYTTMSIRIPNKKEEIHD